MNPESIVQKQLIAYNSRDLDVFSSTFSADIVLYNFNEEQPILSGIDELKKVYKEIFDKSPKLNASLTSKMVLGNTVIYNEKVTGRINTVLDVIAIYEVKDNLIYRLTFIRK
ncbi:MAG: nuclear transport factor 2 family protein [Algibacter sp.]